MADWIVCPGCQLRHTQRADGICPRCRQSTEAAAAAAPSAPRLGRLAQSARSGQLKGARSIMLVVGVMTALLNGFFFFVADSTVQAEIDKEIKALPATMVVDQARVQEVKEQAVRATRLINGGGLVLGLVFVACGLLVRRHPVPVTITGLALYLGGNAIFGLLNPASLASGIVVKVFIVVGLFKAVQAAIAYQKELATAPAS